MVSTRLALLPILITTLLTGPSGPSAPITQSDQPALFAPGVISTGDMELNAAFTPDARTVYFTKRTPKLQRWVILVSHFRNGKWSEPAVAEFSGQYNDFDPFVSPDGKQLFYSSTRPVNGRAKRDFDIWVVDRTGSGWSTPRRLEAPVNSDADEYYPSVSSRGTLYLSSTREGGRGRADLYKAEWSGGAYNAPENLGDSINTTFSEGDPFISADESTLIFVSYNRPEGLGDGDLYISRRVAGQWSKAQNLGNIINSPALDFCPIISPDGKSFFFTSERTVVDFTAARLTSYKEFVKQIRGPGNGLGDVYHVDLGVVNRASQR